MMTALSSEDQRKRGEQLGADRYLVKSQVGIEDVVRTVHEVLGDAPTSAPATSPFATSTPSAQPSAPAAAAPTPQSSFTPAPAAPTERPTSVPTRPIATPANPNPASTLPQPTAPFSTPRPNAGSGRVIEPLSSPVATDQVLFANRLDDELRSQHQAPQPSAPTPQPAATPSVGPAPPLTPPSTPMPTAASAPQPSPTPPLPPAEPTSDQPS